METITDRIKKRAKELNITQVELARKVGKTKGAINQWFKGATKPNGSNLLALAKALDVTPEWLETGKEPQHQHFPPPTHKELASLLSVSTETYRGKLEEIKELKESGVLDSADEEMLQSIEAMLDIIRERYKDRLKK